MDILRSDLTVAIDELQSACTEAARVHRAVAEVLERKALSDDLTRLAGSREEAARWLTAELHDRDDAPHPPPGELALLKKVAVWAESLVGQDEAAILRNCADEERSVAAAAAKAIACVDEGELRRRLEDLLEDARKQVAAMADETESR